MFPKCDVERFSSDQFKLLYFWTNEVNCYEGRMLFFSSPNYYYSSLKDLLHIAWLFQFLFFVCLFVCPIFFCEHILKCAAVWGCCHIFHFISSMIFLLSAIFVICPECVFACACALMLQSQNCLSLFCFGFRVKSINAS